jgi:hypothetical protein
MMLQLLQGVMVEQVMALVQVAQAVALQSGLVLRVVVVMVVMAR